MNPNTATNEINYDDEQREEILERMLALADAMTVLAEIARQCGVATIPAPGEPPPAGFTPEAKAKYLAQAKARKERGDAG